MGLAKVVLRHVLKIEFYFGLAPARPGRTHPPAANNAQTYHITRLFYKELLLSHRLLTPILDDHPDIRAVPYFTSCR